MPSKSSLPNNFCVLPWVGVHTRNDPVITPCCDYSNTPDIYKGHNIKEYQNSDSLKTVKDQFLKGEWPAGCWKCKEREERSGHSLRIQAMHNYKGHSRKEELYLDDFVTSKNDKYFKLNLAFSNICNLGCVMCVPSNSSFFWEEKTKYDPHHFFDRSSYDPNAPKTPIKHHIEKPIPKKNTQKNPCIDNYTKEDLNNLINSMDMDANPQIQLHGGEPSIMYQSIYFLQKLEEKKYTNIQLEFNSNFQHYNYKFFDKLKNFSKGHALVSIDAIGVPGEYIRYPSNWNKVFSNVIKFKNEHGDRFRITICPTMQILNIFYIDKLVNWTNQFNFNLYLTNNVIQPSYFAINNLPERAKEYLTNKIKKMNYCPDDSTDDMRHTVINLLNSDPTDDLEYTIFKLNQIDSIRDTNWKQSFPELANYIL